MGRRSRTLKPVVSDRAPTGCAICQSRILVAFGDKDFSESGADHFEQRRVFADVGVRVAYHQCTACRFTFSAAFDSWSAADFEAHVYNAEYVLSDKPFVRERPMRNAAMVAGLFDRERAAVDILDVGGGRGVFAEAMRAAGFSASTRDPYFMGSEVDDARRFDLITSFEVIEHVRHDQQHTWMASLARLLRAAPWARVLISTELISPEHTIGWWYLCPRNGHISVHSASSLRRLASTVGLQVFSVNPSMHWLWWAD
jgi:hypothetical protein